MTAPITAPIKPIIAASTYKACNRSVEGHTGFTIISTAIVGMVV